MRSLPQTARRAGPRLGLNWHLKIALAAAVAAALTVLATYALSTLPLGGSPLRQEILWIPIILTLIIALITFLLIRSVLAPVQMLRYVMERIASGHYGERLDVGNLNQDLALVVHAFNRTCDVLEQRRRLSLVEVASETAVKQREVARVIHERAGQTMAATLILLDQLLPGVGDQGLADQTRRLQFLLKRNLHTLRDLINDLSPQALEDLGLAGAVAHYGTWDTPAIKVDVQVDGILDGLPPRMELEIYRIAQDVLASAVGLYGAEEVHVMLRVTPAELQLAFRSHSAFRHRNEPLEDRVMALGGVTTMTPHELAIRIPRMGDGSFPHPGKSRG